jgi:single-strand DNA-binding protein
MPEKSLNKVTLLGRIGADPDIKYTQSGQPVCTLNVATNQTWKDEAGVLQTKTDWHRVVVWGKLAETCHEYLKKGSKLYLEGSLHTRQYDDKDGQKKYITEIKMNEMIMLDSRGSSEGGYTKNTSSNFQPGSDIDSSASSTTPIADDLPF